MTRPAPRMRIRGRILIEMLLAMPIILSLAMGAAEYGYFMWVKGQLEDAAVAGARAAILTSATNSTVTTAVDATMQAAGLQSSGYTVATNPPSVTTVPTGTPVTVTVSCNWGTVGIHPLPSSMGGIPTNKTVTCSTVMMRE